MNNKIFSIFTILVIIVWSSSALALTSVYQYGGINYSTGASLGDSSGAASFWSTEPTWQVLNAHDSYKEGTIGTEITFVGNSTYPGAYFAQQSGYLYFRVRTEYTGTVTFGSTFSDTVMVMIDTEDYNYNSLSAVWGPDFSFAWDTAATPYTEHGLEIQARSNTGQGSWDAIRFDDLDRLGNQALVPSGTYSYGLQGNGSSKKYSWETTTKGPDFGLIDADGYIRTIDGVPYSPTGGAPTTYSTFIDFAISINYLNNIAPQLMDNPIWNIQFGSINQANDHNLLDDVAGSASLNGTNYSGTIDTLNGAVVPLPSAILLLGTGLISLAKMRRKFQAK